MLAPLRRLLAVLALLAWHGSSDPAQAVTRIAPEFQRKGFLAVDAGGEEAAVKFSTLNDEFHDGILWHCGSQRLRDLVKRGVAWRGAALPGASSRWRILAGLWHAQFTARDGENGRAPAAGRGSYSTANPVCSSSAKCLILFGANQVRFAV